MIALLISTIRLATPLIFAALGGLLSERSGVINIALEGLMLVGAWAGAVVAQMSHSSTLGAIAAMGAGAALAWIYAWFVVAWRADQIVAGTAINLFAMGMAPVLSKAIYGVTGSTPSLSMDERWIYGPPILAFLCVGWLSFWIRNTPSGLWVSFAGEHPSALQAAGLSPVRIRLTSITCGGALAGLGGASLSIFLSSSYSRNMTAGRGFIALAAIVLGKWKPIPTAVACLLFGFADAIQTLLQGVALWGNEAVPVQLIQILPYGITLAVLAGFVGQSRPPKALGRALEMVLIVLFSTGLFASCRLLEQPQKVHNAPVVPKPSPKQLYSSAAAQQAVAHAELLKEMYAVVLIADPQTPAEFNGWVNSLNQGASLEGIYNAFTHSAHYRELETKGPASQPKTVKLFAEELAALETDLSLPTAFTEDSTRPLAKPVDPGSAEAQALAQSGLQYLKYGTKEKPEAYQKFFSGASFYTLKRILGEEAMKLIAEKKGKKEDLANWYAQFAVRAAQRKIDYGLELRDRPDEAFHRSWAIQADPDLLTWEVLNRFHRMLNRVQLVGLAAQ